MLKLDNASNFNKKSGTFSLHWQIIILSELELLKLGSNLIHSANLNSPRTTFFTLQEGPCVSYSLHWVVFMLQKVSSATTDILAAAGNIMTVFPINRKTVVVK